MASSYANQIQTVARILQTKFDQIWGEIGLEPIEKSDRLREFEGLLTQTIADYEQDQRDEAKNLQLQIQEYLNDINEQRRRMGIETQLPKLSGTYRQQREQCLSIRSDIMAKVEEQEKRICVLVTNLKRLCCQLGLPSSTDYDAMITDNTNRYDLSHTFIQHLTKEQNELQNQVEANMLVIRSILPYLVYYMKEMNLFEETSQIHSFAEEWHAQGHELNKHEALIGRDVYEQLEKSLEFKHTALEVIISTNVNFDEIPHASTIPPSSSSPYQSSRRQSLISSPPLSTSQDSSYIFQYYPIDFSLFPVDQDFIAGLHYKKLLLHQMYLERCEFTQEVGHKILSLWELTEMSQDARTAWIESCKDLSLMTLRRFQFEFLRLMQQKSHLLPQWIAKYENMIRDIGNKLGIMTYDINDIIHQCEQTLTQDDQLHALRTEFTHLDTRLKVCQPILDKIAQYTLSCSQVHLLKDLEQDPNRFKDSKVRARLEQLRKSCKDLPKKAASLYTEITKFESSYGQLLNCGQPALAALEQDDYYIQAVKQGYIRQPRQSANSSSGIGSNSIISRPMGSNSVNTTMKTVPATINTTLANNASKPAAMKSTTSKLSSDTAKPLSQTTSSSANRTMVNSTVRLLPSVGGHGAAKPIMSERRSSRELGKRRVAGRE